ncbi:MAG: sulfotransferase [Asticcacaulis sp.]
MPPVPAGPDLHDSALRALIAGRLLEADAMIADMLRRNEGDARAWSLKARLAAERGDFTAEMHDALKTVNLAPGNGAYLAQLGKCHARRNDMAAALACADAAEALPELDDVTLDAIASIHTRLARHARAADILTRAAAGSRNAAVHFNLGASRKFCGDFDGARDAFEAAIALAPDYHKAHAALTSLGGITADRHHLDRLLPLIARTPDATQRIHLSHAAAKEFEALGRHDDAFAALRDGKAALRQRLDYRFADDQALFDSLHAAFDTPRDVTGFTDAAPVFVVGMPRSGTTVLDRIVSNHPDIASIGETQQFPNLLKQSVHSTSRHVLDGPAVAALTQAGGLTGIGRAYCQNGEAMSRGRRFLDKFHLNVLAAGFIAQALPKAQILCMVRDPLDTIVSNYRQLFEFSSPTYRYHLDLAATARFYVAFRRLVELWAARFPRQFHVVGYEDLVRAHEPEVRRILDLCGLSWEERCLRIEDNDAPVATASAVQVRQPINACSIGNWRRYEAHLDEVKQILSAAGLYSAV